jgi:nitrite reductase (NADH) small subunit
MEAPSQRPVEIGSIEDVPVGKFRILEIGGVEVGVTRLANGEIRAVRNYCPHKGAPICRGTVGGTWPPCEVGKLEFARAGEVLVCPWHGFEYDLETGHELFRETPTRLVMYAVTVENERVLVDINRRRTVIR